MYDESLIIAVTSIIAIFCYFYVRNIKPTTIDLRNGEDYGKQSIVVEDNARLSRIAEKNKKPIERCYDDLQTLVNVLERGQRVSNDGNCLGTIVDDHIEWMSYGGVLKQCKYVADAMLHLGVAPKETVGIYSANCIAYTILEYGLYHHSMVLVPIYDTLGSQVAQFIANEAELKVIVCDSPDKIEKILEQAKLYNTLKHLVLIKPNPGKSAEENVEKLSKKKSKSKNRVSDTVMKVAHTARVQMLRERCVDNGIALHTFEDLLRFGQQFARAENNLPKPEDLALICYTSGTTSMPKGVMLTHGNIVASASSVTLHMNTYRVTPDDVMLSILPLAHMFQRMGEVAMFIGGGKIVYYSGVVANLAKEIQLVRPMIMLAVPRILNRIHEKIHSKMYPQTWLGLLLKPFMNLAFHSKYNDLKNHSIRCNTIWDLLIFNKVRDFFGGRLRFISVGSAPLSPDVLKFLRCALGCVISEGYGQTECVAPSTATLMGEHTPGHVGPPLTGCMMKLADFLDMGYKASEGKGEILIKGPIVFKGYYKRPELTSETLDSDGWLHTGDIGEFTPQGTVRLLDRKKNIFKLAQGEYIAPEKIENVLTNCSVVSQLIVHGEGLRNYLVAILVPNYENLKFELKKLNIEHPESLERITGLKTLNKREIKNVVLHQFKTVGLAGGLKSFELPKNVLLYHAPFTIEQGFLTPTLKAKRSVITAHFKTQITNLYEELSLWEAQSVVT